MNIVYLTVAAALGLAAISSGLPDYDGARSSAEPSAAAENGDRLFKLRAYGVEPSCSVTAGALISERKRTLTLGERCKQLDPNLLAASQWLERPDGTVAFAGADGRVLLEFAVADGAAYETFSSEQPMMVLLAND